MNTEELQRKAKELRHTVLDIGERSGHVHVTSCFSCVEILVALYYGKIYRPDKDAFILSKGHAAPLLYVILADLGYFPKEWLDTFGQAGSRLGTHPDIGIPGIEITTGSLGHGLGIAAGMALAAKMDGKDRTIYVLLSDGECYEGSTWEAAMFAAHHRLNNLVAIIDHNDMSATAFTEETLALEPLAEKWGAFEWMVYGNYFGGIPGHDMAQLGYWLRSAQARESLGPYVIIAATVKGKGVPFMENQPLWHGRVPKGDEYEDAKRCLL